MPYRNVLYVSSIIFYIISELISLLLVFIILAKDRNQIWNEIFSFKFGFSTFDLVLFGVLRFAILIGALIGLLYNHQYGVYRLNKYRKFTVYYGCIQAIYIVMKVLIYMEDNSNHIPERFWIMVSITLLSCMMLHCCWRILTCCKRRTITLKLNVNNGGPSDNTESDRTVNTNIYNGDKVETYYGFTILLCLCCEKIFYKYLCMCCNVITYINIHQQQYIIRHPYFPQGDSYTAELHETVKQNIQLYA